MSSTPIIPPEQLERFARELGLNQAILVGWVAADATMHVVTWGASFTDSAQAAQGGNAIKRALGFPETLCRSLSPRVATALEVAGIARLCIEREWSEDCVAPWEELTALCREPVAADLVSILAVCDAIPDVTISKWACDPGHHWNAVRDALRTRRAAQGLNVDAEDPHTAFDEHGWLRARRNTEGACSSVAPAPTNACRRCTECVGEEHHWLTSMPECPMDGEPFIPCKHCDARAAICEQCFEGPVWPPSNVLICEQCKVEFHEGNQ